MSAKKENCNELKRPITLLKLQKNVFKKISENEEYEKKKYAQTINFIATITTNTNTAAKKNKNALNFDRINESVYFVRVCLCSR